MAARSKATPQTPQPPFYCKHTATSSASSEWPLCLLSAITWSQSRWFSNILLFKWVEGRVSTFLSPLALLSYQFSKVILGKNHLRNLLKMQILLSCLLQLALGWNVEPRSQNFKQVSPVSPVQVTLYLYFGELGSTELLSRPCTILTLPPRHPTSLRSSHLNTVICGLSSQSPIFTIPNSYHHPGCSQFFACHWAYFQGMSLYSICNSFQSDIYIRCIRWVFIAHQNHSLLMAWNVVSYFIFLKTQIVKYLKWNKIYCMSLLMQNDWL